MKTISKLFSLMIVSVFLFVACEKEKTINPNQIVIQQMESVTASIVQHAKV